MRHLLSGVIFLSAVAVSVAFSTTADADDPDGIEVVMFDENGDVRDEPFSIVNLYMTNSCEGTEI